MEFSSARYFPSHPIYSAFCIPARLNSFCILDCGATLRHGAELGRVQRFAQVHFHQPERRKQLLSGFRCARTTKLIGRE
jgi:hypothetical protein